MNKSERLAVQLSTNLSTALFAVATALLAAAAGAMVTLTGLVPRAYWVFFLVFGVLSILAFLLSVVFGGKGIAACRKAIQGDPERLPPDYDGGFFNRQALVGLLGIVLALFAFLPVAFIVPAAEPSEDGKTTIVYGWPASEEPYSRDLASDLTGGVRARAGAAILVVVGLLVGAGVFLLTRETTAARAAGSALLSIGTITFGLHLVRELDIGSLIMLDGPKIELGAPVTRTSAPAGLHSVASLVGFDRGDTDPNTADRLDDFVAEVRAHWCGEDVATPRSLLLVGSADRLLVRGVIRERFGGNEGIARDRGERVKSILLEKSQGWEPGCRLSSRDMTVLTRGPSRTTSEPSPPDGFPEDRRVDVFTIGAETGR